jgi:hypothetical protein
MGLDTSLRSYSTNGDLRVDRVVPTPIESGGRIEIHKLGQVSNLDRLDGNPTGPHAPGDTQSQT